ncbi:inositol monophosphatase family protein [Agaribacterium haliotis]|uniref:inositol monophosphatase family protein n=1 Tax=Agaribacterium haliotis TaxID=2013869 RepID=UPI000BB55943|nr:inositol monophosphatase family protein [Agaribacterium haliotis]
MEPMLNVALKAARKAGEVLEHAFERVDLIEIEEKGRNDFVSEVDRASEKEVIYHLKKAYPDHKFVGEESGVSGNKDSEFEWIIDPLDGTTNFLHAIPHFAVSIACRYKGQIEHAVVLDPIKREEFTASRGRGATLNGRRIRVSNRQGLDGALIGTGVPFNGYALEHIDAYSECMKEVAGKTAGIRRPGSAALDLAYVAAGRFDGFWEMNLQDWDIAGGLLLAKEAGAMVSDFKGGNSMLGSGNVVCATPKLFKPLLQIVGRHMGHI